jgi:hypothetical protein
VACGSREWADWESPRRRLALLPRYSTVVTGGLAGAESACVAAANALSLPVELHPYRTELYGVAAGPRRNSMLMSLGIDLVLCWAFTREFWETWRGFRKP